MKKISAIILSFFITATAVSQIYLFTNKRRRSVNYSGIVNLVENIRSISTEKREESPVEDQINTADIIKMVDGEISSKIKQANQRLKINTLIITKDTIKKNLTIPLKVVHDNKDILEINNSSMVTLGALEIEKTSFNTFENIEIGILNHEEEVKDQVVTTQSSALAIDEKSEEVKDFDDKEMVMFDYTGKASLEKPIENIDQKNEKQQISQTVKQVIEREIKEVPAKKMRAQEVPSGNILKEKIALENEENIIYDYAEINPKKTKPNQEKGEASGFVKTERAEFVLQGNEINLDTQEKRVATNFEFVPDSDRGDRKDDQGSGKITFEYWLSGNMNTQTGVINSKGMIPTRVELNYNGHANLQAPLINEEGMQKFLQKQKLSIEGNLLMVMLNSTILDVEIDSTFAERFFFDNTFKPLSGSTGASFVMFAGVKTGNILVRYLLNNKESAQKIVYVGDGEMYFEDAEFVASSREIFVFTTRNLLGQKRKELTIDGGAISFFGTNITARKKALNAYEIKVPAQISGMRKYLEFKHMADNLFVGISGEQETEIPSREFISKALEMNDISSLRDRCLVQVNVSKDLRDIKVGGKNQNGEMFAETSFLDGDGEFSRDSAEMAEKVFIVGDMEGLFNIKLEYSDDTSEFLKTFCSKGTYLVEQL